MLHNMWIQVLAWSGAAVCGLLMWTVITVCERVINAVKRTYRRSR
jgi:hypothetical protein